MPATTLVCDTDPMAATLKANGRTLPAPYDRAHAEQLRQAQYRAGQQYTGALHLSAGVGNTPAITAMLSQMEADWQAAKVAFNTYMDGHELAA